MKIVSPFFVFTALALLHVRPGVAQSADSVPAQATWKWQPMSTAKVPSPTESQWWQVFNDPLLDSLVSVGLANNLDIKVTMSRLEEARSRVKVAESYFVPSVRFDPSISTQNLAPNRPLALQARDIQINRFILNTYQLPIDVSYEVDIWQRLRRTVTASRALVQATEAEQQTVRLTVSSEIARTYLLIRSTDTEKRVLEQSIGLRDSTLEVAQARYKAGLTTLMDVQRAETEVANARVQLQTLQRSRAELELSLGVLLGASAQQVSVKEDLLPAALPPLPSVSPADLPLRRPDLIQSERLIAAATDQIQVNKAALRPRLNLVGSAGLTSRELNLLLSQKSTTYLLGASVTMPIYEGNRNRNNVAIARQQVETASITYQQRVLTAQREVETAMANLRLLSDQIVSQQMALESARKTRRYSRELYVKGLTTFLDVVDSERTALELERQAVNLKGQQALYTVALIKAIGGNW